MAVEAGPAPSRPSPPVRQLKVLHFVETYLNLTENWVYSQIERVPGCEGRVVCRSLDNLAAFPIAPRRLLLTPPPWSRSGGIPRLINSLAFRLGRSDGFVELCARTWPAMLLHAHFGTRGWQNLTFKRRLRIPLLTSFYGYDAWMMPQKDPVWRTRYQELFREGDVFLVEGPAMRQRLVDLGCPPAKIKIHHIGVDLSVLPFSPRDFSDGLKIAMVGRFIEKKGLADGLRACALASARGTRLRVTIIGDSLATDPEGAALKAELQTIAQESSLAGRVRFAGFLPLAETRALLGEQNVFLTPSLHARSGDAEGGSPVVLTEAMALGVTCVGTRHCDIPELIVDGKTGYLTAERDVAALAAILGAIEKKRGEVSGFAAAGRRHVEQNFSLEVQLREKRALYDAALSVGAG